MPRGTSRASWADFDPGRPPAEAAYDDHALAAWTATVAGGIAAIAVAFGDEVHFTRGGYALNARAKQILARDVKWLASNTSAKLSLEGHADPTGSADANMTLSQKRAEAVRDYLVSSGVDGSRLEVNGFGDTQLKYDAADARNRRVMLIRKD